MTVIPGPVRSQSLRRGVGMVLGLGLLGLAVWYAVAGADFAVIRGVSPWVFLSLAGLVVANLLLTAGLFGAVTRPFAPRPAVKLTAMTALIAVSGVLNYIPVVRAGLWGRAAYLKKFHGLAVRDSVVVLGVVLGLAVAVLGTVCLVLLLFPGEAKWWACGAALLVQSAIGPRVWAKALRRSTAGAWLWVPLRTLDLAAAAGRLWIAFGVVGVELSGADAVLLASATLIVKLVGLTPNGLGLSEWVIAALSAAMMPIEAATAAAAALVDRTIEVVVMLIAGAIGAAWLKHQVKINAAPEAHAG